MKKSIIVVVAATFIAILSGCANGGAFMAANQTSVELGEKNYEIVATSVTGTSTVAYLFGGSFSIGGVSRIGGIFKVTGTGEIYNEALEDLWKNYETEYGSPNGQSIALANVRYDTESVNLLLYTSIVLIIRADVVRFTG